MSFQFDNNLKLCYCEESWAWFTTCPLEEQWGDDWNDVPWEHNAGYPYEWREEYSERGIDPYNIVQVAWEGPYILPNHEHINSPYSVQMINRGDIAWLRPSWHSLKNVKPIHAGTTLEEFVKRVKEAGGRVYLES